MTSCSDPDRPTFSDRRRSTHNATTQGSGRVERGSTGLARLALLMINRSGQFGQRGDDLKREAGLSDIELSEPDNRIPLKKLVKLWTLMVQRTSDPALGVHLAQNVGLRDLGLVGYIIFHSQTLSCGLNRLSRYSRIVADDMRCSLIPEGDRTRLAIATDPLLAALRHPVDTRLVFFANAVREVTGVQLDPVEVHFPYRRRTELAAHQRVFRAPLVFGRRTAALIYRIEDLRRPATLVDDNLQNYLEQLAKHVMESLDADRSFANRVRGVIWAQLSDGKPTRRQVAERLGVSVRTLQRRLSEERTSFASLLDDLRRQMSLQLLRDSDLAVYEIAFLLGYSDPSTFYQAFRRWTGSSPRGYRTSRM